MLTVQVLMSTYNGEKYLKEQIDSVVSQTGIEVHLLVRDDGSKDGTVDILKCYRNDIPNIEIMEGENIGSTKSFLELVKSAGDYDFYAFADQDDVWDADKLSIAIDRLKNCSCPAIYSGNTRLVDGELKFIKNETLKPVTTLGSAIVKNYVTGCTTVFNAELMKYLKRYSPWYAPFHDWWANLVCLAVGGVSIYDYEPHMSYRQHGNNVVSGNDSAWKKWTSRLKKFNRPYCRDLMAKEILTVYSDSISMDRKKPLELVICRKSTYDMTTGNKIDDLLFKICLLFGKQ